MSKVNKVIKGTEKLNGFEICSITGQLKTNLNPSTFYFFGIKPKQLRYIAERLNFDFKESIFGLTAIGKKEGINTVLTTIGYKELKNPILMNDDRLTTGFDIYYELEIPRPIKLPNTKKIPHSLKVM